MKAIFITIILTIFFIFPSHAQVKVEATVTNQQVVGSDVVFDIYLRTAPGTSGPLYLDNADFVFAYHDQNFSNPVLTKEPNPSPPEPFPGFVIQNGFCTFISTDFSNQNSVSAQNSVQKGYFDRTAVSIVNNQLVISLNGVAPSDQTGFDENVAIIDDQVNMHRLGRFRLSGIVNTNGSLGLSFIGAGTGLKTRVFTIGNGAPFLSSEVPFGTCLTLLSPSDISLPITLISFKAWPGSQTIHTEWTYEDAFQFAHFELERALDGRNFEVIHKARVSSEGIMGYEDKAVRADQDYYYRLKLVDLDGSFKYSDVQTARLAGSSTGLLRVYPNPATDQIKVNFENPQRTDFSWQIFNNNGVLITEGRSDGIFDVEVSKFGKGCYHLMVIQGEVVTSVGFVVQ